MSSSDLRAGRPATSVSSRTSRRKAKKDGPIGSHCSNMRAMHMRNYTLVLALTVLAVMASLARPGAAPARPQGPCDIYAAAGDACVAAHSTTRALYASYNGPLYKVLRQSDGKTLDIGVVRPSASPVPDPGGYANAAAQDAFCANT